MRIQQLKLPSEVLALVWATADSYARRRLACSFVLMVAVASIASLAPLLLKGLVDELGSSRRADLTVFLIGGLYVVAHWLARVLGEIRGYVHAQADRQIYSALSDRLFAHVLNLPVRYHLERRTGAINEVLANGLQGYQMILQSSVYTALPVFAQLGIVVIVLIRLELPVFLSLFLFSLFLYAIAFARGASQVMRAARAASAAQVDTRALMIDSILNYETVKYFTAEDIVRGRFGVALARTQQEWMRFHRARSLTGFWVSTIFAVFLAATVLYAIREVMHGRITLGTFVLVNTYMFQLVSPIEQAGLALQQFSQGVAFLEKLLTLLREKTEAAARVEPTAVPVCSATAGRSRGAPLQSSPGKLAFEKVVAAYGPGRTILKDLSFEVQAAQTLGIVGASGAGKSTIVRLLMRSVEPDSGRILLDGSPIDACPLHVHRRAIAVVPQETVLFADTIAYNIGFGRLGSSRADIEQAARVARLHDFILGLQDGYETRVGERGVKLSGGERQRISIARAVIKQPRIFLFDEATSSLDALTERQIMENLRQHCRHSTTIVIAHRLSTVVHADQIVLLHEGRILEQGVHEQLLQMEGRYSRLWHFQQSAHRAVATPADIESASR